MSQAMHMSSARHDENAFNHAGLQAKENGSSQQASKPLGSAAKPLQLVRKAFGNITNTKGDNGAEQQQHTAPKRRAFGDLTNSTAKASALKASCSKAPPPVSKLPTGASSSQRAPVDTHAPQAASTTGAASALAAEGVERSAGKTWAELEAERERQADEAINKSVSSIIQGLVGGSWPLGRLQVLQDTSTQPDTELLQAEDECKGIGALLAHAASTPGSNAVGTSCTGAGADSDLWGIHADSDDTISLLPDVPITSSGVSDEACTPTDLRGSASRTAAEVLYDTTAASPVGEPW